MKLAYTDMNSSSYYDKNPDNSLNKSISNNSATVSPIMKSGIPSMKNRNKENLSKTRVDKLDKMDASKITLRNKNKSKSPSFDLKS